MDFLASLVKMLPDAAAQGLIWGILALGVYITYKVLDFSDLTVDGSICTGGAVAALLILNGVPMVFAMAAAFVAGEEKQKLTVPQLLELFSKVSGSDEADDKLLLS